MYILAGPDDFSLAQSLEEIKRDIGDPAFLAAGTTTLEGQPVTLDQLRTVCETVPFLGGKRLVIIHGLLARFEAKEKSGRRRQATRAANQPDEHKSFGAYFDKIPDSTVVVFIEGGIAKDNPLLRELAGKAMVKTFPLLRDTELRQWVKQRVTEVGSSMSSSAADLLTRLVGSNLWILASEIDKLVLFASGRRIEEADVKTLVSYTQQASVFAMVDAIVEFRTELAEQWLERLLQRGAAPAYLLTMLSRQVRMIVRAKELSNQRKPKIEIQTRLGLPSEFALRKTLEQANRYSSPRLTEVYQRLLETDLSIKTGRYDGELALNILVAELCQRGKPRVA